METDGKPQCILLGVERWNSRWEIVKAVKAARTNLQLLINLHHCILPILLENVTRALLLLSIEGSRICPPKHLRHGGGTLLCSWCCGMRSRHSRLLRCP